MIKKTRVFDQYVKIDKVDFTLPDGRDITRMVVERGSSVSALVYNVSNDMVYLVEQTRIATGGRFLEVMAGMIDENETPEEAVLRELNEELGFEQILKMEYVGEFYLSPGLLTETNHVFVIYVSDECSRNNNRGVEDEDIVSVEISGTQLAQMLHQHEIKDAKTMIATQQLFLTSFAKQ